VLRAWLETLFVALASDTGTICRFLWIDGGDIEERDLRVAGAAEARAQLSRMVAAWRDGLRRPLPLFPDASLQAFRPKRKKPPPLDDDAREEFIDALVEIAAKVENDGPFGNAYDFDKPSVRLAWRGRPISREDAVLAARLYDTACALFPRLHMPLPEMRS